MYVKFPLGDLNPDPYLPHSTSTYTCGVIIAPRVHNVTINFSIKKLKKIDMIIYY